MKEIRTLKADEIECRVAQARISNNRAWCSLLLYKDARVDQRLLDEVVGAMNWKRDHQLIGDRLYCTVSIWDSEKKEWVSKQDVGTESNTEKEKGQASDSFKRACFNWGIGRELYSAPQIFIDLAQGEYTSREGNSNLNVKARFSVSEIEYDKSRNITSLVIVDSKGNERFTLGAKTTKKATKKASAEVSQPSATTTQPMVKAPIEKRDLEVGSKTWMTLVERAANGEDLKKQMFSYFNVDQKLWEQFGEAVVAHRMKSVLLKEIENDNNNTKNK